MRKKVWRDPVEMVKLRANERNNSQHQCWSNNVGSFCALGGSGVLTNTTTSTTPNNASTCSASREGYNPKDFGEYL